MYIANVVVLADFGVGSRTWFVVVLASSDLSVSILATVAVHVFIEGLDESE